jgi:hypothetical protein
MGSLPWSFPRRLGLWAGAALLPVAHKAVSATSDFRTMADSLKESLRGSLRVGTILDPEFIRLGPFVRSLATSLQKTEVFLRYGMSDDVLAQIGKGDLTCDLSFACLTSRRHEPVISHAFRRCRQCGISSRPISRPRRYLRQDRGSPHEDNRTGRRSGER